MREEPRILLVFAAATAAILVATGVAQATATSGRLDKGMDTLNNGQYVRKCAEAIIADVADNKAWAYTGNSNCFDGSNVPGGYLGANLTAYRDGAYCGQTSTGYNGAPSSGFGIGAIICSNPGGLQTFYTNGYPRWYKGPSYPYNGGYIIHAATSPNQSY